MTSRSAVSSAERIFFIFPFSPPLHGQNCPSSSQKMSETTTSNPLGHANQKETKQRERSSSPTAQAELVEHSKPLPQSDAPEGGIRAWTTVAGSILTLFSSFGVVNSYVSPAESSLPLPSCSRNQTLTLPLRLFHL